MDKIFVWLLNKWVPNRFQYSNFAHHPSLMRKLVPEQFYDLTYLTPKTMFLSKIKIIFAHIIQGWHLCDYLVAMFGLLVRNSGAGLQVVRRPIHGKIRGLVMLYMQGGFIPEYLSWVRDGKPPLKKSFLHLLDGVLYLIKIFHWLKRRFNLSGDKRYNGRQWQFN